MPSLWPLHTFQSFSGTPLPLFTHFKHSSQLHTEPIDSSIRSVHSMTLKRGDWLTSGNLSVFTSAQPSLATKGPNLEGTWSQWGLGVFARTPYLAWHPVWSESVNEGWHSMWERYTWLQAEPRDLRRCIWLTALFSPITLYWDLNTGSGGVSL